MIRPHRHHLQIAGLALLLSLLVWPVTAQPTHELDDSGSFVQLAEPDPKTAQGQIQLIRRTLVSGGAKQAEDDIDDWMEANPGHELMVEALMLAWIPADLVAGVIGGEGLRSVLLGALVGDRADRLMGAFAGLFSAALLATFSWRLASHAYKAAVDGATTNALAIPLAPFGYLASFLCLVSAFLAFMRGIDPPSETDGVANEENRVVVISWR